MIIFLLFVSSIVAIVTACELFSNSVEWIGDYFSLSSSTTGSLLAATGTALPESILPIIAFFSGTAAIPIGTGAILGAPLMLSTLTSFIMAAVIIVMRFYGKRKDIYFQVPPRPVQRDLLFFIANYLVLFFVSYIFSNKFTHFSAVLFLIISYLFYVMLTVKDNSGVQGEPEKLYFSIFCKESVSLAAFQLILSLMLLILAGKVFVVQIGRLGAYLGASLFIISIIIAPFATELPEKYNSFRWLLKKKDTLALTNITGAMVFQSVFPVMIGLVGTRWQLGTNAVIPIITPIASALLIFLSLVLTRRLSAMLLAVGGVGYLINLYIFLH